MAARSKFWPYRLKTGSRMICSVRGQIKAGGAISSGSTSSSSLSQHSCSASSCCGCCEEAADDEDEDSVSSSDGAEVTSSSEHVSVAATSTAACCFSSQDDRCSCCCSSRSGQNCSRASSGVIILLTVDAAASKFYCLFQLRGELKAGRRWVILMYFHYVLAVACCVAIELLPQRSRSRGSRGHFRLGFLYIRYIRVQVLEARNKRATEFSQSRSDTTAALEKGIGVPLCSLHFG